MKLSKYILTIFFCSTLAVSAQVDSNAKRTSFPSNEKQVSDSSKANNAVTKEKSNFENKQEKKTPKLKLEAHKGGIGYPEEELISSSNSIQLLKDSIKELEKENAKLKKRIEKLETEDENLLREKKSRNIPKENTEGEEKHFSIFSFPFKMFLSSTLFVAVAIFLFNKKARLRLNSLLTMKKKHQQPLTQQPQKAITSIENTMLIQPQKPNPPYAQPGTQIVFSGQRSFSNVSIVSQKKSSYKNDWFVVGASAIGKSHITSNKPCQDNHYCENIGNGWGIAISCDGAGSADNSDLGSEYIAKNAFKILKKFIDKKQYHKKNTLPSDGEWNDIAKKTFIQLHQNLEEFAKSKSVEINSVACTVIAVIYSPIGLLVAHLGDGRAGYCNENGDWKSIITPHKGEEANQTIFISSSAWKNRDDFIMSGVTVPEFRVIREKPIAFTLMSDGCENHSFECSKMDTTSNKWNDPNIPFPKFFNPLVEHLKELNKNKVSIVDANSKWKKFVEEGTQGMKEESDDKTLILGILI